MENDLTEFIAKYLHAPLPYLPYSSGEHALPLALAETTLFGWVQIHSFCENGAQRIYPPLNVCFISIIAPATRYPVRVYHLPSLFHFGRSNSIIIIYSYYCSHSAFGKK